MRDKVLIYIRRGYGLVQLMETLGLSRSDLLKLMAEDKSFTNKVLKRYSDKWLRGEKEETETTPFDGMSKAIADKLGITYNANIGEAKLKERLVDFIKDNPEAEEAIGRE